MKATRLGIAIGLAFAGSFVVPAMRAVSASDVSSGVLTDFAQLKGRKAMVDIAAGTPITPDLLELPLDE